MHTYEYAINCTILCAFVRPCVGAWVRASVCAVKYTSSTFEMRTRVYYMHTHVYATYCAAVQVCVRSSVRPSVRAHVAPSVHQSVRPCARPCVRAAVVVASRQKCLLAMVLVAHPCWQSLSADARHKMRTRVSRDYTSQHVRTGATEE